MIVREYQPSDLEQLQHLHRKGMFDYSFPDLSNPAFVVKRVLDNDGEIITAACLRSTTEAFLLCSPEWRTPRWRWEALNMLHEDVRSQAKDKGIEDVHCWIPPSVELRFGKRLRELGWERERPWPCYSVRVNPNV